MSIRIKTLIYKSSTSMLRSALLSALVLTNVCTSHVLAQDSHSHTATAQTTEQQNQAHAHVKIVRDSTERFQDVKVAVAAGYALQFGCVSGDDWGAMGLHYVNGDLVNSGI